MADASPAGSPGAKTELCTPAQRAMTETALVAAPSASGVARGSERGDSPAPKRGSGLAINTRPSKTPRRLLVRDSTGSGVGEDESQEAVVDKDLATIVAVSYTHLTLPTNREV